MCELYIHKFRKKSLTNLSENNSTSGSVQSNFSEENENTTIEKILDILDASAISQIKIGKYLHIFYLMPILSILYLAFILIVCNMYRANRLILGILQSIYLEHRSEVFGSIGEYTVMSKNWPSPAVAFSTFAKLKLKYCVLPGPKGIHIVCVCKYHHNPKLIISSIKVHKS